MSGHRGIAVVSAVPGHGATLVAGEADADTWHVDRAGTIVAEHLGPMRRALAPAAADRMPRGVLETDDELPQPVLCPAEVEVVAALARRAERLFGCPPDIEWSIEAHELFLLQSQHARGKGDVRATGRSDRPGARTRKRLDSTATAQARSFEITCSEVIRARPTEERPQR